MLYIGYLIILDAEAGKLHEQVVCALDPWS